MPGRVVLTVGNLMMGDDAAGPLLAQKMQQSPLPGWAVIDGGAAPENHLHQVRELAPERVLVVDAAEMGEPAGAIKCLSEAMIAEQFILTTHSLPLTFLLEALHAFVPEVVFVGIQPQVVAFAYPVSPEITAAVSDLYLRLQDGDFST
jgi:hydrogenase 3 maturation protease